MLRAYSLFVFKGRFDKHLEEASFGVAKWTSNQTLNKSPELKIVKN